MKPISEITANDNIDDWIDLGNGICVHRYNIIGTTNIVYRAYEKSDGKRHTSLCRRNGIQYGEIDTRRVPDELARIPIGTPDRNEALDALHTYNVLLADMYVKCAFPNDFEQDETLDHYDDVESFGLPIDPTLEAIRIARQNMREE